MILVGYFEGIGSQRGIAWRCSDSRSLAAFIGIPINERTPEHSSLSRVHERLPLEIHEEVLLKEKTLGDWAEDIGKALLDLIWPWDSLGESFTLALNRAGEAWAAFRELSVSTVGSKLLESVQGFLESVDSLGLYIYLALIGVPTVIVGASRPLAVAKNFMPLRSKRCCIISSKDSSSSTANKRIGSVFSGADMSGTLTGG